MNRELWVERHSFSKAELLNFAWLSGDHNPIHYSERVVRDRGFEKLIVHGMCLYCWVYSLALKMHADILITAFEAKFSSITWVDEEVRVEAENRSEGEIKVTISGLINNEIKCVFYIEHSKST